jgi:magnesium transporter
MPADDRADLYNRLGDEARQKLLPALAKVERDDILKLASYPEGTVGSVTTSDYAFVSPAMTVGEALQHVRATAPDKETVYVVYVLDEALKLRGAVSLRDLVLAAETTPVADIMRRDVAFARANWPKAEAAELIRRHDLLALPVLNGGDRMIGIVTVDDAMDIEKERDATQLARFGGTASIGGPDLDVLLSPFRKMFQVRVFWLAMLTFFGVLTSTFVAAQEEILTRAIVLAAFIAPIVDMGGNTGSQSATLVIRAMALGDLRLRWHDVWLIVRRELPVALALGAAIAILEVVLAYFAKGVGFEVLVVVGLSMLACTVLGGVIGALLPFAARRVGTDPATLSSPLITSVMDLLGVFIYFGIAYAVLGDLVDGVAA